MTTQWSRYDRAIGVVAAAFMAGCGLTPTLVPRTDERLKPLWAAIERVDRESLGFTPIPESAEIRFEGKQLWGNDYDAMLHVDGETSRTIGFRKTGSGYEWIGEQETHTGPGTYTSPDGSFHEEIVITYETQHLSGAPLNQVFVTYRGDDARLKNRSDLSWSEVRPILHEWKQPR